MSLKLYQINTTLNHPDCMAGLKKMMDDEIIHWKILRKQIIFFVHLHCCFLSDLLKKLEIY